MTHVILHQKFEIKTFPKIHIENPLFRRFLSLFSHKKAALSHL
jgi:hypothetical protein